MRPEDALQAAVTQYLDRALPSASWWTATANGAFLAGDKLARQKQAARMKRTGIRNGTPDILVLHDGRLLTIELKSPKGRLSDDQRTASDAIIGAGGGWRVCRSIDDVAAYLDEMGVPLRVRLVA